MNSTVRRPADDDMLAGFGPVHAPDARLLVLGSMPGVRSLEAGEYYAHPRNAFWPIMEALFGVDAASPYVTRLEMLRAAGVALWDVIGRCRRRGSLDQKVEPESIVANDFGRLLADCPRIRRIGFNGGLAEHAWRRHVAPSLEPRAELEFVRLPSTSPAHAAMTLAQKTEAWRRALLG